MFPKIIDSVMRAVENGSNGIANLEILESLRLWDADTLKTTISRLNKSGRIIRLKRGVYSTYPMRDAYVCAQETFNGYLGFSTALYLHKLITETPFTITVVTTFKSQAKEFGRYEFRAVALKEKAVGFERKGEYVVSTRAKTLFDCLYLPKYGIGENKLIEAFKETKLSKTEWREFDIYLKKFSKGKQLKKMKEVRKEILGGKNGLGY